MALGLAQRQARFESPRELLGDRLRRGSVCLLANHAGDTDKPEVIGDSAYGSAAARLALEDHGYPAMAKAAPVRNSTGGFTKEDFDLDLGTGAVTCPAGHTVPVHFGRSGEGKASFKGDCRHCPLKDRCTPSRRGRTISVHPQEALLRRAESIRIAPDAQIGWMESAIVYGAKHLPVTITPA